MHSYQVLFSNAKIADVFGEVWYYGGVKRADMQALMFATENALNIEERAAVDRILHAIRRGWLKVLD